MLVICLHVEHLAHIWLTESSACLDLVRFTSLLRCVLIWCSHSSPAAEASFLALVFFSISSPSLSRCHSQLEVFCCLLKFEMDHRVLCIYDWDLPVSHPPSLSFLTGSRPDLTPGYVTVRLLCCSNCNIITELRMIILYTTHYWSYTLTVIYYWVMRYCPTLVMAASLMSERLCLKTPN